MRVASLVAVRRVQFFRINARFGSAKMRTKVFRLSSECVGAHSCIRARVMVLVGATARFVSYAVA